jgi:hypothetical protein
MKELLERFIELERRLSAEKGDFDLFALFLREDSVDKWDLVVAAPWIESDRKTALSYITNKIQETLAPGELSALSRVVLVDLDNPGVRAVNEAVTIQHGPAAEIKDSNFFGLQIKHAYIVTSQRSEVPEEVLA